jgi:hypothetical protein
MIESLEHFFSKELLYICLIAILLNITLSFSFPIIYKYYPTGLKKYTSGLNIVTLNLSNNLFSSSIYLLIIIATTLLLTYHLRGVVHDNSHASVLNLANLSK